MFFIIILWHICLIHVLVLTICSYNQHMKNYESFNEQFKKTLETTRQVKYLISYNVRPMGFSSPTKLLDYRLLSHISLYIIL